MNEWRKVKLKELITYASRGITPKYSETSEGIIVLNQKCIRNQKLNLSESRLHADYLKKVSLEKIIQKYDILINSTGVGTLGRICQNNLNVKMTVDSHITIIRPDINKIDPIFLGYSLKNQQSFIENLGEGSTGQTELKKDRLINEIEIKFPLNIGLQKKISKILSDIDNKIELNNKINNNLEEQIQVLFSKWLSNNFKFSNKVTLEEVCSKITDGSHFSPKDNSLSSIPMLSVKDMEKFDFNLKSCKHISETDYQKMLMNDCVPKINDILVAKDGSYLKEIFICNEERRIAILSSIAIFRPNLKKIYPEILLAFLKSPNLLKEVRDNYVSGSALPRIVLRDFKKLSFYLPSIEIQSEISSLFYSIRKQIAKNIMENEKLINLKNYLLPKLMNGEIDVKNIEL